MSLTQFPRRYPFSAMKPCVKPSVTSLLLSMNLLGSALVSAELTWDADGAAGVNPSDGGGAWLGANWWDGTNHTTWNNVTHANTQAIFGSGGAIGTVTLGSGVSAGGLRFDAVLDAKGYLFGSGTLTLAPNAVIDIRDGASNAGAGDRVRFTSFVAGSDITISNAVDGGSFASYATFSGNNTWTGTLTLTGNSTGLFVDTSTANALNTLTAVNIGSNATLALNTGTYTVPTLRIGGSGLGNRGSLRFDNGIVNVNSNIILTSDGRMSTNANGIGVINGVISGNFNLAVSSGTDAVNKIVLKNTNTFNQLTVSRGNVQIGEAGVGTGGRNVVNLNGSVANPAIISGTGKVLGGLYVSGGSINPGDNFGVDIGTLIVTGNLNFTGVTATQTVANFTLGSGGISDRINVSGDLRLQGNGNFSVLFDAGYTPTLNDSWTLIDWNGTLIQNDFNMGDNLRTGADADGNEGNLNLADLTASGYRWNVGTDTGALVVTIVPEPSVAMLSVLAVAGFASRRRRSLA